MSGNEEVTYSHARAQFLARIPPEPALGGALTEQELDEEVRVLISVGRYTLDRWGAETEADQKELKDAAREHLIDCCSMTVFFEQYLCEGASETREDFGPKQPVSIKVVAE